LAKGEWTDIELTAMTDGLRQHGKDWIKIQSMVKTRSVETCIAHAQKIKVALREFCPPGTEDLLEILTTKHKIDQDRLRKLGNEAVEYLHRICGEDVKNGTFPSFKLTPEQEEERIKDFQMSIRHTTTKFLQSSGINTKKKKCNACDKLFLDNSAQHENRSIHKDGFKGWTWYTWKDEEVS